MTALLPDVTDLGTLTQMPDPLRSAYEPLAALRTAMEALERCLADAESNFLVAVKAEIEAGMDRDDLADAYVTARGVATNDFHQRWNATLPVQANGFATRVSHRMRLAALCATPNGPGGHYWAGVAPIDLHDPRPPRGKPVVYVLYDAANEPIYVGSTDRFHTRLTTHLREGKPVARWMAYPCADREKAYELEQKMLDEFKLPLNVSDRAHGIRPAKEAS